MGAEGAKFVREFINVHGKPISQAKGRSKSLYIGISVDAYVGVDFTGVYAQYSGFFIYLLLSIKPAERGKKKREMFDYVGNVECD